MSRLLHARHGAHGFPKFRSGSDRQHWPLKMIAALCSACALAQSAHAGFDEGLAAARQGRYMAALQHFQPLAAEGDAASQFNLALMYQYGLGLPRDPRQALRWLRKSAANKHPQAQVKLAELGFRELDEREGQDPCQAPVQPSRFEWELGSCMPEASPQTFSGR